MKSLIILFGAPGSGKGMVGDMLAKSLGVSKITTGDIFRAEVKNQTARGKAIAPQVNSGQLVKDSVVNPVVFDALEAAEDCVILDGYPRRVSQFKALREFVGNGYWISTISLTTPVAAILERIGQRRICKDCGKVHFATDTQCSDCGGGLIMRMDDANIQSRIIEYQRETSPVLRLLFAWSNQFISIDGTNLTAAAKEAVKRIRFY